MGGREEGREGGREGWYQDVDQGSSLTPRHLNIQNTQTRDTAFYPSLLPPHHRTLLILPACLASCLSYLIRLRELHDQRRQLLIPTRSTPSQAARLWWGTDADCLCVCVCV